MLRFLLVFIIAVVISGNSYARGKDQKCLSYWSVGAAACKKVEEPKEETPPPPPPVVIQQPQQPSPVVELKVEKPLSEKEKLDIQVEKEVDDFLENHGKPPREFARFMINPTLENALVWAQKYNDMLKRTEETTVAWMKATHILEEKEAGNLNADIPTLGNKRRVVPDYGLKWDTEAGTFLTTKEREENSGLTGNSEYISDDGRITAPVQQPTQEDFAEQAKELGETPEEQLKNMFALMQQAKQQEQNAIKSDKKANIPSAGGDINKLLPNSEGVDDGKIHVNYYFSAECPYCKKFEPEFQKVINELGRNIEVTCVDMTPSNKDIVNIYGKVDCEWRPLMPDEMRTFGVKSTPTLLVRFPDKSNPEKLEGFVSATNLRTYLKLN